jgi:hypothetical protein
MFWLSYERWDFADFGGFWYKSGGRTTGVGVQEGNRLHIKVIVSLRSTRPFTKTPSEKATSDVCAHCWQVE